MQKFSAPGSETLFHSISSIPLKNPEDVMGEEETGGLEKQAGAKGDRENGEGEDIKWAEEE